MLVPTKAVIKNYTEISEVKNPLNNIVDIMMHNAVFFTNFKVFVNVIKTLP